MILVKKELVIIFHFLPQIIMKYIPTTDTQSLNSMNLNEPSKLGKDYILLKRMNCSTI